MSVTLEEYVRLIEGTRAQMDYKIIKAPVKAVLPKFKGIKAVLFDVYGTLIASSVIDWEDLQAPNKTAHYIFKQVADEFDFTASLKKLNPDEKTDEILRKLFFKEMDKESNKFIKKGIEYPEVNMEIVWKNIVEKLIKRGYKYDESTYGNLNEFGFKVSFFQAFSMETKTFYPEVTETLKSLNGRGIKLGIVSNAQFFTIFDILRQLNLQSEEKINNLNELFEEKLTIFSFEYNESKPSTTLFKKAFAACKKKGIREEEIAFVGNDLLKDIWTAKQASSSIKTILFAADKNGLKLRKKDKRCRDVKPDAVITSMDQLLNIV